MDTLKYLGLKVRKDGKHNEEVNRRIESVLWSNKGQSWVNKTAQASATGQLSGIQRLACLSATGTMRTTPTIAMEVLGTSRYCKSSYNEKPGPLFTS